MAKAGEYNAKGRWVMAAERFNEVEGRKNVPTLIRRSDHSEATERVLKIYFEKLQATKEMFLGQVKEVTFY